MRRSWKTCAGALALLAIGWGGAGCSKTDIRRETVASANGEDIKVLELREFLGVRGGVTAASGVPAEKKKEALERLIAGRLLAQEARSKGLDNTDEFRSFGKQNEQGILITALFRKEISSRGTVSEEDIRAEANRMQAADNTLSPENAQRQAGRAVSEKRLRKVEEDLVAAARKDIPSTIDQAAVERMGKGEKLAEADVLATVAGDNVTFGDVRKLLLSVTGGLHGGQDFSRNPMAIQRVLDREIIGRALAAYAKKQGIEGSEWEKSVRLDVERTILIDLLVRTEIGEGPEVTDDEVAEAYKEHAEMFVRDGKKIPFSRIKDQLRGFLRNEGKRKALETYIEELKKKASIKVNEKVLVQV